eukprot:13167498-Heterocapsa_arctica.AAC.1
MKIDGFRNFMRDRVDSSSGDEEEDKDGATDPASAKKTKKGSGDGDQKGKDHGSCYLTAPK